MRRRIQRIGIFPLIGLLLGVGILPDVVFCSSNNGHRAFELTTRDCCHGGAADDDCHQDHCASSCNDIRFSADAMLSSSSQQESARDSFVRVPVIGASFASEGVMPVASSSASRVVPYDPVPRQRHTTVQLC